MIRKILFPVDFSPSCTAMAAYVQRAAALCGATVSLVHVCDLASHSGFELYARPGNEIAEDHWNVASEKLDYFLISEFPPATSARILLAGDAASVIAETAKKSEFDLIVMPTHAAGFDACSSVPPLRRFWTTRNAPSSQRSMRKLWLRGPWSTEGGYVPSICLRIH